MTISNARISFDRPYVEEVEFVQQNTKTTEPQKQELLVFDDEVTFNRKRSSTNEVIDNTKFKTTTAFNSRTDCSPSGHVWRFAKSMHDKLTGG